MSKNYYVNNPSYYRSHQYAHQYNLPDSAMNNRKMPLYTTEMPQGNDPFLPSHKKHFQRVGYRSIISQEQLINHQTEEQANSPSKNKNYYRNLSIDDIEGASTNTLISQALKNRIKAKQCYLRRQKQEKQQYAPNSILYTQDTNMQSQALRRFKANNSQENYHKIRSFKTQGSDHIQSYNLPKQPQNNKISQYKQQIEQASRDIQQLQRKLNAAQQSFDPANKQKLFIEQKSNSNLMFPKIGTIQKDKVNLIQLQQKKEIGQLRKRSHTQPNENQNYIYPQNDKIKQHKEYKDSIQQSRLRRMQIRKLNPTYLSYGTYAVNNSTKKVYL